MAWGLVCGIACLEESDDLVGKALEGVVLDALAWHKSNKSNETPTSQDAFINTH
jgi:hypothetical protein